MNEEEFFRILGIEVRESDDETSFYYEEYFYDVDGADIKHIKTITE